MVSVGNQIDQRAAASNATGFAQRKEIEDVTANEERWCEGIALGLEILWQWQLQNARARLTSTGYVAWRREVTKIQTSLQLP